MGTTVGGFPNFFMLLGPNTGLGHSRSSYMVESQLAYVVVAPEAPLAQRRRDAGRAGVGARGMRAEMDGSLASTVWNAGGCRSWYLDRTGRNSTIWPGSTFRFRRRLRTFDPAPYELGAAQPAAELASA